MPLVPDYIANLHPYQPGRHADEVARTYYLPRVVKLASNENPLGSSPASLAAIHAAVPHLNTYPDGGLLLRQTLAREFDTKPENVIAGNGSEALIANIIRTFLCDDDEILTTEAAFVGFQVVAKSRGAHYRTVPLTANYAYDLPAIAQAITQHTKIIYLANPNNPTGTIFTKQEFDAFYRHVPERVLIILDEAYFEYAKDDPRYPDSMSYRYDNVITLRTFSKVYGLAGARIGYGFAHEELIANLLKVKLPFEPGTLAQAAGIAALKDRPFLHRSLEANARAMAALESILQTRGIRYIESRANFVMTVWPSAQAAAAVTESLLRQGVIVRPLAAWGLPQCVRISVGTEEEIAFFRARLLGMTGQIDGLDRIVRPRAGDHRDPAARFVDADLDEPLVFVMAQGRAFACRADRHEPMAAALDLPVDQRAISRLVHATVAKRGDQRGHGTAKT